MANAPFPIDEALTAITVAYRNMRYIADDVLPRVPVGKQEFKYWSYPVGESFRMPDSKVGRRSRPNEVVLSATETTAATEDFALEDPIPQADLMNAPMGKDPRDRSVMQLTDYIALGREKRTADAVFAAATYASTNKVTLSGTSQWSDGTNSNPIAAIMTGIDACLVRPNIMVMGREVFTKLAQHPKIVEQVRGTSAATSGVARRQQIADIFELEELLVGESWLNTAAYGQTATLGRVWGKHALLAFRDRNADTRGGITFGFTAEWGSRVSGSTEDPNIGMRGGTRVRVGESLKELVVAPLAAYLFIDAVA
jgi:hypothetical protein